MKIDKIFTLCVILYPILSIYSTPIMGVTIADMLLGFILVYIVLGMIKYKKINRKNIVTPLLYIGIYILFQVLVLMLFKDSKYINEIIMRSFRYIVYIIVVSLLSRKFFKYTYAKIYLEKVSIFSTFYIIIQTILIRVFHYYLPGTIPGMTLTNELVSKFNETANQLTLIRPRSIFSEPAGYASYVIVFFVIKLFSCEYEKNRMKVCIFISIGILCSMSNTGIVLSVILWGIWLGKKIISTDKFNNISLSQKNILLALVIVPIISILVVNSSYFSIFLDRTFSTTGIGASTINRISSYLNIFYRKSYSLSEIVFGHGMIDYSNAGGYIPAIPRIFYYYGIMGVILYLRLFLYLFKNLSGEGHYILLTVLLMSIAGDAMFGVAIIFYFPFMLSKKDCKKSKKR